MAVNGSPQRFKQSRLPFKERRNRQYPAVIELHLERRVAHVSSIQSDLPQNRLDLCHIELDLLHIELDLEQMRRKERQIKHEERQTRLHLLPIEPDAEQMRRKEWQIKHEERQISYDLLRVRLVLLLLEQEAARISPQILQQEPDGL